MVFNSQESIRWGEISTNVFFGRPYSYWGQVQVALVECCAKQARKKKAAPPQVGRDGLSNNHYAVSAGFELATLALTGRGSTIELENQKKGWGLMSTTAPPVPRPLAPRHANGLTQGRLGQ